MASPPDNPDEAIVLSAQGTNAISIFHTHGFEALYT
jgi:hypothetical protein